MAFPKSRWKTTSPLPLSLKTDGLPFLGKGGEVDLGNAKSGEESGPALHRSGTRVGGDAGAQTEGACPQQAGEQRTGRSGRKPEVWRQQVSHFWRNGHYPRGPDSSWGLFSGGM
jgi:hypothetical protein